MKALWVATGGPWILPMLHAVRQHCDIEMLVPEEGSDQYREDESTGVRIHHLPLPKGHGVRSKMTADDYALYKRVIDSVNPDIIHVHGAEINLGQIQNFEKTIPVVISVQGLLSGCLKYNTAFVKPEEIKPFKSVKNRLNHGGLYQADRICRKGFKDFERDILVHGKYFFGRTNWDKAMIEFNNPAACYFKGEELLRPEFYENKGTWDYGKCEPHTIFMPSGFNPLKGMHIAVSAIGLLKKYYPDVRLRIPGIPVNMLNRTGLKKYLIGEDFLLYVKHLIESYGIENNIEFLPWLSAKEMVEQMLKSEVYLSCSTIDNSSNAVGEATLLGMPLVVTAVGGLTSFLHDEENCLLAPSGDEYMIAYQIKRLFENKDLSVKLSRNAFDTALQRHDKDATGIQYHEAYKQIISLHKTTEI